jgi:hypothetical protein
MWTASLKPYLQRILEKNTRDLKVEERSRHVFTMVFYKAGETLYTRTHELLVEHLEQKV